MGFVKLPSENPASDSQPQTSEASCQGESSAEMRVDVQSLEETPAAAKAPNQPSSGYTFPKRKFGGANRSFQSCWTKQFPWLHYNESNDSAFCWFCMKLNS